MTSRGAYTLLLLPMARPWVSSAVSIHLSLMGSSSRGTRRTSARFPGPASHQAIMERSESVRLGSIRTPATLAKRVALSAAIVLIVEGLLLGGLLALPSHRPYEPLLFGAAFIVLTASCLLLISPFIRSGRQLRDILEPAAGIALVSWVGFGLGAVYSVATGEGGRLGHDPIEGLTLAACALLLFAFAYLLPTRQTRPLRLPDWRPHRAMIVGFALIAIGVIGNAIL